MEKRREESLTWLGLVRIGLRDSDDGIIRRPPEPAKVLLGRKMNFMELAVVILESCDS